MDLNQTPLANRTHIAFFGIRNAGKSSIMNALTNQNIAVVSPVKGTTTDPVHKAMELLPLGPVNIIDTAGLDDIGELGKLRIEKTKQILNKTDIAILVIDATLDFTDFDRDILKLITDKNILYIVAYNKVDLVPDFKPQNENIKQYVYISAKEKTGIEELKSKLVQVAKTKQEKFILKNIVKPLAPIKAAASSSSFPSELSTGIISLDTYGNVTNIVASTTPGIAKAILILLPVNSLNHLITG